MDNSLWSLSIDPLLWDEHTAKVLMVLSLSMFFGEESAAETDNILPTVTQQAEMCRSRGEVGPG